MERETLTVEEAAQILGISRSTAYEAAKQGELPVIRLRRRLVVPRQALEQMLGTRIVLPKVEFEVEYDRS